METETSSYWISQSALLLSFWSPPADPIGRRSNTFWLGLAIDHAKNIGAHRYGTISQGEQITIQDQISWRTLLKRLWWCCILRDCSLSLGLRRRINITHASFDFKVNDPLSSLDMSHEIDHSEVYDRKTKLGLVKILSLIADLCIVLADILDFTSQFKDNAVMTGELQTEHLQEVLQFKTLLNSWYTTMQLQFPWTEWKRPIKPCSKTHQNSIILHIHIMYMFYQYSSNQ